VREIQDFFTESGSRHSSTVLILNLVLSNITQTFKLQIIITIIIIIILDYRSSARSACVLLLRLPILKPVYGSTPAASIEKLFCGFCVRVLCLA
jgi:hypothetical protein